MAGAAGKMGRAISLGLLQDKQVELVGAVDLVHAGEDYGKILGTDPLNWPLTDNLRQTLIATQAEVMVDFTRPDTVLANAITAVEQKVSPIIGTTGLDAAAITRLEQACEHHQVSAFMAPNFALGAVLMMLFAQQAARYFPQAEIIELHHDQKLDAPSGTALRTAAMIVEGREQLVENVPGGGPARGMLQQGVVMHSVRLPGMVAHQEVIFGGIGQTLTIRHDSLSRESFIPGVLLAVKQVRQLKGVVVGLENLLR